MRFSISTMSTDVRKYEAPEVVPVVAAGSGFGLGLGWGLGAGWGFRSGEGRSSSGGVPEVVDP